MKSSIKRILIIAGETSGDIHGAGLVREINKRQPGLNFFGIGGDNMIKAGVEPIYHIKNMSFLGFFEVLKHLPFVFKVFNKMVDLLEKRKPSLVILIDYPGFNLRFAKKVKKKGIKVFYYISPQIWAWGKNRVKAIARWVDLMVVILPFEEAFYRSEGINVRFVGHPLKDVVRIKQQREDFFKNIDCDPLKPTIGILPGSREQEIQKLLPEMIKACKLLKKNITNFQVILGIAPSINTEFYEQFIHEYDNLVFVRSNTYEVMAHSDIVLVASGTATLETALLETPMIVLYKMAPFSYFLGKILIKVRHIALVNIVAGREVVPELLQSKANAEKIALEVYYLLNDRKRMENIKRDLSEVSQKLGEKGATNRAAKSVLSLLERNTS
jgi:lipid-A-disaccharide synthase